MVKVIRRKKNKAARVTALYIVLFIALVIGIVAGGAFAIFIFSNPLDDRVKASQVEHDNTILVRFNTPVSEKAIEALNSATAVEQVDAIPALGIRVLRVPPTQDMDEVIERYSRNSLVEFAEVNELVIPEVIPNDPNYGLQWHHPKIETPAAWDMGKATNILIAICDTGVLPTHEDLQPVLRGDLGWNTASNNNDWSNIAGHGTLASGAAAAAINNGIGVSGVAWGAQIIPVRITNDTRGYASVSNAVKCIQYGADKGATAINVSYRMAGYSSIETAGKYALSKGAVVIVAGGNDGTLQGYPDFPSFLAVAASVNNDTKASYSSFGDYVDLAAPGTNIRTTTSSGSYLGASGTSMSAPLVAGVVALVAGANPSLNASQIQSIILSTADDIGEPGEDIYFGHGRVNARRAVEAALQTAGVLLPTPTPYPTAAPTSTPTPTPPPDTISPVVSITNPANGATVTGGVKINATATDNVKVVKMEIYIDDVLRTTSTKANISFSWNTRPSSVLSGEHTILVKAYDTAGNVGQVSITVTK